MRWCVGGLAAVLALGSAQAQVLQSSIQSQTSINQGAQASQQRIDSLASQTEDLVGEYRGVIREVESLKVYNGQLKRVVDNQRVELASMDRQIEELENTNRGVVPLMVEMIDMLGQIVEADVPFKIEERRVRVTDLRDIIDRADVTNSEKFRRIMEAYQLELDYGRNAAHYEATLPGTERNVDFLYVGRTLLIYQTKDRSQQGWWNPATRQFEELGGEYAGSVRDAMKIARNQSAPDLVKLPVPAPVTAQ